jgi:hypothetical protein
MTGSPGQPCEIVCAPRCGIHALRGDEPAIGVVTPFSRFKPVIMPAPTGRLAIGLEKSAFGIVSRRARNNLCFGFGLPCECDPPLVPQRFFLKAIRAQSINPSGILPKFNASRRTIATFSVVAFPLLPSRPLSTTALMSTSSSQQTLSIPEALPVPMLAGTPISPIRCTCSVDRSATRRPYGVRMTQAC